MNVKDSCIFYADWLDAAHTIEDPKLRCCFFEAVLQYSLTGMEMEVPPELKIVMTVIKRCVDRDRDKYEKKIEKRREAGIRGNQVRWGDSQSIAKIANATNASQSIAKIADNVNENDNDKDNNVFNTSPIPPNGGRAKSFEDFYGRVIAVRVPKAIEDLHYERQYVWRMAECIPGYGVEIAKAIQTKTGPALENAISDINKRYMPKTQFVELKLAMEMAKLKTAAQKKAFSDELRRSENEPDIFRILTEKAEYINQGGHITSLAGFMKSRK